MVRIEKALKGGAMDEFEFIWEDDIPVYIGERGEDDDDE